MAKQGQRTRDMVTGVLALALLAAAGVGAWTMLFQDGRSATGGPVAALDQDGTDGATAEQVGGAEDGSEDDQPELRISVLPPATLAVDRARPVLVDVATPDGRPLDGDTRLALRATVEPAEGFRGYLSVVPGQATTTARELRMSKLEVAVTGGAPCDRPAGTLTLRVMELGGDGRQATREVDLPDVACATSLPGATDALHMTDPVCGAEEPDDGPHTAELQAILDGEDQESTWCMSDEKARELGILPEEPEPQPRRGTEPQPREEEEEDEDDEDDDEDETDEDADDDGDDETDDDGDDDTGNGTGGNSDDTGDGGNGNGGNGNGGNGNGDDDTGNGTGDDGDDDESDGD